MNLHTLTATLSAAAKNDDRARAVRDRQGVGRTSPHEALAQVVPTSRQAG